MHRLLEVNFEPQRQRTRERACIGDVVTFFDIRSHCRTWPWHCEWSGHRERAPQRTIWSAQPARPARLCAGARLRHFLQPFLCRMRTCGKHMRKVRRPLFRKINWVACSASVLHSVLLLRPNIVSGRILFAQGKRKPFENSQNNSPATRIDVKQTFQLVGATAAAPTRPRRTDNIGTGCTGPVLRFGDVCGTSPALRKQRT